MYNQKTEPPVKNMKFIQYELFVENEEKSEHGCVDEIDDNTTQTILMNPFAKRIEVKPTDINL